MRRKKKTYKEYLEEKKEKEGEKIDTRKLSEERKKRLEKIKEKEKKKKKNTSFKNEEKNNDKDDVLERLKPKEKNVKKKKEKNPVGKTQEKDKSGSARDVLKQKIADLEEQISNTRYNKKTQHAIGLMKAQLASLKEKLSAGKGSNASSDYGYNVRKTGDATAVLLGFPSSGKSTLLNNLTNKDSEVADYAFTTLSVIPGILEYKKSKIQILDVPGIVEGAASGTGRGKEVLQVLRTADLIIKVIDPFKPQQREKLDKEVYESHVRLNESPPDVKIKKKVKGGIDISRTVDTPELDDETIKTILKQFRILNADILIRSKIDADKFIDVIENNKVYVPGITIVTKKDLLDDKKKKDIDYLEPDLFISAQENINIDELKEMIFNKFGFIRIYLKEINKKADLEEPMIMKREDTLKDLCSKLHKDFIDKFRFARLWGSSAKFEGQKIENLEHEIEDNDVIELHMN
ncbi:MAG: OBG GTPase family GTP-binding protein [Nanobdellota archaeon]